MMADGSHAGIEATTRAVTEAPFHAAVSDGQFSSRLSHVLVVTFTFLAAVGLVHISGPAVASTGTGDTHAVPFTSAERVALRTTAENGTVRVSSSGCGPAVVGSGYLSVGGVVTNRHLVVGDGSVWLNAAGGGREDSIEGAIQAASRPLDVAIVHLAPDQVNALRLVPLVSAEPVGGEPVLLAGYGGGGRALYFLEATVHLVVPGQAYGIDGEVVLIDHPIIPGFSGGPVLNRRGEVIAVLKGMDETTGLAVAISTAMLSEAPDAIDMKAGGAACS